MNEDMSMDPDALWRDETFTDQKVGTIRVLTPVKRDGSPDGSRKQRYVGQASLYTPAGPLPISFELDADSLEAACSAFADAAKQAVDEAMEQLREMRREQASSIVVPGAEGGGKLQMP